MKIKSFFKKIIKFFVILILLLIIFLVFNYFFSLCYNFNNFNEAYFSRFNERYFSRYNMKNNDTDENNININKNNFKNYKNTKYKNYNKIFYNIYKFLFRKNNFKIESDNIENKDYSNLFKIIFTKIETQKIENIKNDGLEKFTFFGDVIPHSSVKDYLKFNDVNFLLSELKNLDLEYSINFYNLETTILNKQYKNIPYIFSAKKYLLDELNKFNINYFTIANNHILDYGDKGFYETVENIKNYKYTGIVKDGSLFVNKIFINNKTVGIVGLTLILNDPAGVYRKLKNSKIHPAFFYKNINNIVNKIKEIKFKNKDIDYFIVSIHWGREYNGLPTKFQIELAKKLIDNGVDIVWGQHPHVVEPVMIYKGRVILFSCGNFISGQALLKNSWDDRSIHKNYFFARGVPVIKLFYKNKELRKIQIYFYFTIKYKNKIKLIPLKTVVDSKIFYSKNSMNFIWDKEIYICGTYINPLKKQYYFLNNKKLYWGLKYIDLEKTYIFMKNNIFFYLKKYKNTKIIGNFIENIYLNLEYGGEIKYKTLYENKLKTINKDNGFEIIF